MSLLARRRAKRAKAKRSLDRVRVLRSANAPMLTGLRFITGATPQEAAENRRKALDSVIANAR